MPIFPLLPLLFAHGFQMQGLAFGIEGKAHGQDGNDRGSALIGFAGSSVYFVLPGSTGWLYVGAVMIAATAALLRLLRVDDMCQSDVTVSVPLTKVNV
jgi:hypothetical protein